METVKLVIDRAGIRGLHKGHAETWTVTLENGEQLTIELRRTDLALAVERKVFPEATEYERLLRAKATDVVEMEGDR